MFAKRVDDGASEVVHAEDSRDGAVVGGGFESATDRLECRLCALHRAGVFADYAEFVGYCRNRLKDISNGFYLGKFEKLVERLTEPLGVSISQS